MRGIGRTLSRLPAARAFVIGAAVLATIVAPKAYGQSTPLPDETALAIPRLAPRASGTGLPQPLPPSEAARLRRLFALQSRGDIAAAVRQSLPFVEAAEEDTLRDGLLGHLLADRHLGPYTRTSVEDLQA